MILAPGCNIDAGVGYGLSVFIGDLARELDPDSSLCSFLEHCYKFGATWKVIEWVDPTPLDGILDV